MIAQLVRLSHMDTPIVLSPLLACFRSSAIGLVNLLFGRPPLFGHPRSVVGSPGAGLPVSALVTVLMSRRTARFNLQ
jgi:hypothetical protein